MELQKAVDLKGKADNVLTVFSDFRDYLSRNINESYKALSELGSLRDEIDGRKKELETLKTQIGNYKSEKNREAESHNQWKSDELRVISEQKKDARKDKEEANALLNNAKSQVAALQKDRDALDKRVRDFEAKREKIAELAR
mgnify:CR=1 FL=1